MLTTKDLLKLSPEEKVEVWFTKFLGWEYEIVHVPGVATSGHYKAGGGGLVVNLPNILDSQSAWNEYVEKPMEEMGYEFYIDSESGWVEEFEQEGEFRVVFWTDCFDYYKAKIKNGQIFLTSLDAALSIPQVLEKINE